MKKCIIVAALLVLTGISIIGCTGSSGGENKYALDFNGENDFVQTSLAANSDFVTVTAWVKVTGRNGEQDIVCDFENSGFGLVYDLWDNNKFCFDAHIDDEYMVIFSDHVIEQEKWYFIAGTYDGSNGYLYVNGEKQAESFAANGVITDSELAVTIGANPDPWLAEGFSKYFTGTIDEVSIWDLALTEQSIQNIMHRTLDSSENGLIGYWRFEEGEGQVSEDMSVNGNDAQFGTDPDAVDVNDPVWTENCAPMF